MLDPLSPANVLRTIADAVGILLMCAFAACLAGPHLIQ